MNNFRKPHGPGNRGGSGGYNERGPGARDFNSRPGFRPGGGSDFDRPKFQAVCDQCHKPCEVPFRPNGRKPVYCNDCFAGGTTRGTSNDGFRPREAAPRASFTQAPVDDRRLDDIKRQLEAIQSKLDGILVAMNESKVRQATEAGKTTKKTTVSKKSAAKKN